MTVINFVEKEIIMSFKNILRVMKHLILLSCFCVSVSYAGVNQKNSFVELTTLGEMSIFDVGIGLGCKYELDANNYFGYILADVNMSTSVFTWGIASDEHYIFIGEFNLEYGYEFMRDRLFSFGLNVSPVIPTLVFEKSGIKNVKDWIFGLRSSLGVFGNFNINDSFEVAIEAKAVYRFLNRMLLGNLKEGFVRIDFFPIPLVELKGRYYF